MKTKSLIIAMLACAILLVAGCSKNDEPVVPSLELSSKTAISFTAIAAASEAVEITVTTNQSSWNAVSDQTWCVVTRSGDKFTVTAVPNTLLTAPAPAVITVSAGEAVPVKIDVTQMAKPDPIVAIQDAVFKNYLIENFDTNNDREISESEAASVETINVNFMAGLESLKGIEAFVNLKKLYCSGNDLAALDVTKNTALTELVCDMNQLTVLDVSENTALTNLSCQMNQLTVLDISGNTALTKLQCNINQLTSLNVSKNTALTELSCIDNQLKVLNVSQNTALTELKCSMNQIATLDITGNTALTLLFCSFNPLGVLDVSRNIELTELECKQNDLQAIDVTQNTKLTQLSCDINDLTALDVSKNTKLISLVCNETKVTILDVSNNLALTSLDCYQCSNLTEVWMKAGQSIPNFYQPYGVEIKYIP